MAIIANTNNDYVAFFKEKLECLNSCSIFIIE